MEFRFPQGFVLGVSSAATQIEGGYTDHSWNDWYDRGHIKDGSDPAVADDHWNRWREDADLMASLGIRAARFGVEWSRLIPEEGRPDPAAVEHYRAEIAYLKEKGVDPLLTIHHFTNPMWFERRGGFADKANLHYFLELTELVVQSFGDLVADYITVNEPNVFAVNGYSFGTWPPGKTSLRETFAVMSNLAWCHIAAYRLIHRTRAEMGYTDTRVGFASHVRVFDPKNPKNPAHLALAKGAEWLFQGAVARAALRGDFIAPLRSPFVVPMGEYADFIGVNYYTRSTVSGLADGVREGCRKNDLGWEIYPQGLVRCTEKLLKVLNRPVWVTENGTCDNTDAFRARYICEHLAAMAGSGLPFERYYHWCFCDNFEWLEGQSARFGLIHVDYDTQKRTVKNSGRFYAGASAAGGVTEELYQKYVAGEDYPSR
ncbi:MAG TPA: family 1 glycosylhydrolase [Oscillospiraceae bacterium]|nr:family 1 glycosylhydrolase [Oscillospiraceae bacterium]HPS76431.1 family 1 glycosylhydrolase [Oscillospiraceae bacterium]